jgi:hypothetical protein
MKPEIMCSARIRRPAASFVNSAAQLQQSIGNCVQGAGRPHTTRACHQSHICSITSVIVLIVGCILCAFRPSPRCKLASTASRTDSKHEFVRHYPGLEVSDAISILAMDLPGPVGRVKRLAVTRSTTAAFSARFWRCIVAGSFYVEVVECCVLTAW